MNDAYNMAVGSLAAALSNADSKFVKEKPSSYEDISENYKDDNQTIFPVPVDKAITNKI
jgi:hypothetical protein